MNIRQILKHQIWIDTTLICSSNVQQLHRRRQFISSSLVTYKKNKSKRVSAAESRDSLQTTICCHVIYGFLDRNVSTKYQAHANVPTFSSLIPFSLYPFFAPSLTLFNLFRSTRHNLCNTYMYTCAKYNF